MIDSRFDKIFATEEQIDKACDKAVDWINKTYKNKNFIMVGILKGCIPFVGKIFTRIKGDVVLDFMMISSFEGSTPEKRKMPRILLDLSNDADDKNILIVEDIVDSGYTVKMLVDLLKFRGAKDIKICTLFDRTACRKVKIKPDFSGISLPEGFTFGFGLDLYDYLRNVPYVGTLKKEVLKKGKKYFEKKK